MVITRRNILAGAAALASLPAAAPPAAAQEWRPSHPVRFVIPYSRGGSTSAVAAVIQPYLQAALGQPVQLTWIPGNSGITGGSAVLAAEPDGHTVMLASSSLLTAHEYLFGDQLPFKPRQDFAPITRVGETCVLLAIPAGRPWQTLPELVDAIRARPGTLKAATSGEGSIGHLLMAVLLDRLGLKDAVEILHFDGGGRLQAQALVTGQADMAIAAATGLLPLIRVGVARALATTGEYRAVWTPELEMVPAVVESFPQTQLDVADWWGLVARAGTPAAALAAIGTAMGKVLEEPAVRNAMTEVGTLPHPDPTPADFGKFIEEEAPMRQRLVEIAGARLH